MKWNPSSLADLARHCGVTGLDDNNRLNLSARDSAIKTLVGLGMAEQIRVLEEVLDGLLAFVPEHGAEIRPGYKWARADAVAALQASSSCADSRVIS